MTSIELKEAALYFLRFERAMTHIATEFGQYSADVFGADQARSIEIETKVSIYDLRADFKKRKHETYKNDMLHEYQKSDLPNYFYFMVPPHLSEDAINICNDKNTNYGVIVYSGESDNSWSQRWKVVKRGKRMHKHTPNVKTLDRLASRMANEIITAHMLKHRVSEMRSVLIDELRNRFDNPSSDKLFDEHDEIQA